MDEEDVEFQRLYGPVDPLRPHEVADFLAGFDGPWWIVGGWAIEAFSGVPRDHEDIDISILHRDLPELRAAFAGRADLWSVGSGMLRPLNQHWPELHPDSAQVWVREHALAPWRVDIQINADDAGRVVNRRWPAHVAAVEDVTWSTADGVRCLNPQIALLFKAKLQRPKDDADLAAALPLLDGSQRGWLRDALAAVHPGHPWLDQVGTGGA